MADEEKKTVEIPKKFEKLVKEIETLSVLELSELVTVLEDHFNVSAAAPVAVAAAPVGGAAEAEDEKTEFDIILVHRRLQLSRLLKKLQDLA